MRGAGRTERVRPMFGKSEKGEATIVARQVHEGLYKTKGSTGIYRNIWDYIADVVPEGGGEPFRATFTEFFESFQGRQLDVGEKAPVTFDKKREVKFDRSALHEERKVSKGDFSMTMAAISAARERGDLDEVKRLKAEFAAARAQE
jgi:hypothetical protein